MFLAERDDAIAFALKQIVARGGRPDNAALVLTDRENVGWFFEPRPTPTMDHVEGVALVLGRRLDALLPRVQAECPRCAARILATPPGALAVYLRIGSPAISVIGAVPFKAQAPAPPPVPYAWAMAWARAARGRAS